MQKPQELQKLLQVLSRLVKPEIILEIGSGKGGTAWAFSKLPTLEHLIMIDMPGGPWGGGPEELAVQYIANASHAHIHFICGNSMNSEALEAVRRTLIPPVPETDPSQLEIPNTPARSLKSKKLDFLFIDGDHSYEGVKTDFLNYSPLVRPGGIVAFHDICEHAPENQCEVKKFWDELKETWPKDKITEFISEPKTWGGIGALEMP